jgi:hypothetical protein
MKTSAPSFALALAALALLAASTSALSAAPGTDSAIAAALGELPEKLQADVTDLIASMNMTMNTTHFQRFVNREDGKVVNDSMALIKYDTRPRSPFPLPTRTPFLSSDNTKNKITRKTLGTIDRQILALPKILSLLHILHPQVPDS